MSKIFESHIWLARRASPSLAALAPCSHAGRSVLSNADAHTMKARMIFNLPIILRHVDELFILLQWLPTQPLL